MTNDLTAFRVSQNLGWEFGIYPILLPACAIFLGLFFVVWLLSLYYKDASLVDRVWGLGFVLVVATYYFNNPAHDVRSTVGFCLVALWGLRLSLFLHFRNRKKGEDTRYTAMRKRHPRFALWSLFGVFGLQALVALILSFPLLLVQVGAGVRSLTFWDSLGASLWLFGFCWETLADTQMARFKAKRTDPKAVCRDGLWNYSRHPNYFGECMIWWGFYFLAVSLPYGVLSILSPVLITFLLLRVSGVRLLEADLQARKNNYDTYQKEVPPFFPRWNT